MTKIHTCLYFGENIYTPDKLFKNGLKEFNDVSVLNSKPESSKSSEIITKIINGYTVARIQLTTALLFGKAEACTTLAYLSKKGLGVAISPYNEKLFLTIGKGLGNELCQRALAALQTDDVAWEASIWVNVINKDSKNLDKEISTEDLIGKVILLKTILSLNPLLELDAYNSHISIIKVDELETTGNSSASNQQITNTTDQNQVDNNGFNKQVVENVQNIVESKTQNV